ncbi:hypothetical protein AM588_10003567 [Phytophthora nicotianae]|uniref:BED-type domain-containing protein n=1 Tax=Phytophthora nicotianae TaxID=4792 RepID=A0A0W8CZ44_PHYNI|nr:hypothetical protein AM588_10003567 [Phytophthora nicotianae]
MTVSGDICAFFFEPVYDPDAPPPAPPPPPSPTAPKKRGRKKSVSLGGANRHRCKVCHNVYTQAVSTGYTNLLTHLRIKHPDWEEMFKSQQLQSVAPVAPSTEENATELSTRSRSPSATPSATPSANSSAPKRVRPSGAGRKRGPVYEHFEDAPLTPGKKQKTMRCVYCHEDTPQLSARLKLHLSTKCPEVPEDVKTKYAGAVGVMSNRVEGAVANKSEAAAKEPVSPSTKPATSAVKLPTKLQQRSSPSIAAKRSTVNLRVFEEKLTAAMIATDAPWKLLDNAQFREAMEMLHPVSDTFPLTATRARNEVLDRLTQTYDRDCKDILATSNTVTLMVKSTDVAPDGTKKATLASRSRHHCPCGNFVDPEFNENNFIRSYNDYVKQQGDFGEPGVWNAANTSNPMEFWGDYEGDPIHNQLAVVAKTVCSFVPHTCSLEELWADTQQTKVVDTTVSKEQEKCTKIRHAAALNARASAKEVTNRFQPLLSIENEPSIEEFLQSNAVIQGGDELDSSSHKLAVRSVVESVKDGLEDDVAGSDARSMALDASWFDISSAGLDKIKRAVENYLNAVIQE